MNTNVKLNHLEAQVHVSELNWSAKIPNYSPSAVAYSLSSLFTVYALPIVERPIHLPLDHILDSSASFHASTPSLFSLLI